MLNPGSRMLVAGGRILDLDGDLDQPAIADVLIENGRITACEAGLAARLDADVARLDARGKLVIPGLINAHYHSHDVLLRGMYEQLPLDLWFALSSPANYPLSADEVSLRTALGAAECLLNGITTTQDMVTVTGANREHVDAIVAAYGQCGIRVVLALQISDRATVAAVPFVRDLPADIVKRLPPPADPAALQRVVEERLAGARHPRVGWGLGPSAPQRCSDALLSWVADLARRHDLQVFTHVYEARSQCVLARMEYAQQSLLGHLDKFGLLGPRLTIAHGVWISRDEIRRMGAAGASLACNPTSNLKLLNGFAPIVDYAEAGTGIGLGCDNCSGNDAQNMFETMKMFALLWGMYSTAGSSGAAREAFKGATIGGARALGKADELGRVRPGFRADLVLIDLQQPNYRPLNSALRQLVYGESGRGVHTVIVDGQIVVENRRLRTVDEDGLKSRSEAARARLTADVGRVKQQNESLLPSLLAAYEKANQYPLEFDRFLLRRQ